MTNSTDRAKAWTETRPLMEGWAKDAGVVLEGHTVVDQGEDFTCTAYGYDQSGVMRKNSIVVTRGVH
jgi:hypothetical protein